MISFEVYFLAPFPYYTHFRSVLKGLLLFQKFFKELVEVMTSQQTSQEKKNCARVVLQYFALRDLVLNQKILEVSVYFYNYYFFLNILLQCIYFITVCCRKGCIFVLFMLLYFMLFYLVTKLCALRLIQF